MLYPEYPFSEEEIVKTIGEGLEQGIITEPFFVGRFQNGQI